MRSYGQYCPIALAAEVFAQRWTPIIIRNLNLGCVHFGDILDGAPGRPLEGGPAGRPEPLPRALDHVAAHRPGVAPATVRGGPFRRPPCAHLRPLLAAPGPP